MNTNRNSMKYIISEEDSNGLLQLHIGSTFLQMMVMAVFIEKENLHPRHDQIYNQFPMLSCAQNILYILVFLNIACLIQKLHFSFKRKQFF